MAKPPVGFGDSCSQAMLPRPVDTRPSVATTVGERGEPSPGPLDARPINTSQTQSSSRLDLPTTVQSVVSAPVPSNQWPYQLSRPETIRSSDPLPPPRGPAARASAQHMSV